VRVYEVKGVDEAGKAVTVSTVDTATDALAKLHACRGAYRRIWVQDETAGDVNIMDLIARSEREREA
jgi:hypothetical protein